jgi:GNAT superfamily N-acetyltransferase
VTHPVRERVAELLVERTGKPLERGSGYLVASGWVLTAAHVVAGAEAIGVWLGASNELTPDAQLPVTPGAVLRVPEADLALLPVRGPEVEPVLFGRLDRAAVEPLPAVVAGFPRFKLRPAPGRPDVQLRELLLATGSIAAMDDDAVVGYAQVYVYQADTEANGYRQVYRGQIGVLPAGRSRGVATTLIREAMRKAAGADCATAARGGQRQRDRGATALRGPRLRDHEDASVVGSDRATGRG